jgi:hypothetical protein
VFNRTQVLKTGAHDVDTDSGASALRDAPGLEWMSQSGGFMNPGAAANIDPLDRSSS